MNKLLKDVAEFHDRFELSKAGKPRIMTDEEMKFAIKAIEEELSEIATAWAGQNLEDVLDGLIDLIYFALGRVHIQNLPFDKAWARVHDANMQKVRALNTSESKRGSTLDVVKPTGWEAPSFKGLMTQPFPYNSEPKFYIIEGPDACGKTTFAKLLSKKLDAMYFHMTATSDLVKGTAMEDYTMNVLENVKVNLEQGRHVVLDRCWISELCYGAHFRNKTLKDLAIPIAACDKLNPTVVYCMDAKSSENAADRHEQHIDEAHPYKREDFIEVYKHYEMCIYLNMSDCETYVKTFEEAVTPEQSFNHFFKTYLDK